jgi:ATP-binding cassette subfamily B protein
MYGGAPPFHMMWSTAFNPDKPKVQKPVEWKRIGLLFRSYWKQETQVMLCILTVSLLGLVPPILTLYLIDKAIPQHNFGLVCLYVGGMIAVAVISGFIGVYQGYVNAIVGEGIMRDIRTSLVSHLHRMPVEFFTSTKTGAILNRVNNDVDSIDNVITGTLVSIVSSFFTIASVVVTIIVLDWRLAILSILLIPLMLGPLWPVGRKMYRVRKATREKRDELGSLTQETLSVSGVVLIKSFTREQFEKERFFKVGSGLMDLEVRLAMVGRWFMMIVGAMVIIGPSLVWLLGGWLVIEKGVTLGTVVTFVTLLTRLYTPASMLAGVQVQFVSALAVFERIFDYLDMTAEEYDRPGAVDLPAVAGAVQFEDVCFSYKPERLTLDHINLSVPPGQMAAFVGPSGAGKTTICNLVPRFYDVQSGRILIDGQDIRDIKLGSLRSHIGIVTQETYLFHDTIANNLRYARTGASDDELIAAAKTANIHNFIMSLPEGYDTVVGERGYKLSGGERQRLAIARVLLKDPKILILDEATSSLDSENEALIQAALVPLMRGRTSLVIAHRLSTVLAANVVFVVDQGRLVETGTHAELLSKGGLYHRLYKQQFKDGRGDLPAGTMVTDGADTKLSQK